MLKTLIIASLLSTSAFAQTTKAKECSFVRHQHVEIIGKDIPKELKNKILNNFIPDKIFVQKENKEFALKICGSLRPFHDLKDIPLKSVGKEEHHLTKVTLEPDKKGFWSMSIESFERKNEKETQGITAVQNFTSAKSIKEIKDADVVEWVHTKLLVLASDNK